MFYRKCKFLRPCTVANICKNPSIRPNPEQKRLKHWFQLQSVKIDKWSWHASLGWTKKKVKYALRYLSCSCILWRPFVLGFYMFDVQIAIKLLASSIRRPCQKRYVFITWDVQILWNMTPRPSHLNAVLIKPFKVVPILSQNLAFGIGGWAICVWASVGSRASSWNPVRLHHGMKGSGRGGNQAWWTRKVVLWLSYKTTSRVFLLSNPMNWLY